MTHALSEGNRAVYLDDLLIHQGDYNAGDARPWISLQSNHTRDASAVTFDDFSATANEIIAFARGRDLRR